jgi:hypothetical protein
MSNIYFRLYNFLSKKWHFDQIFNEIIVHRIMEFGYKISFQLLDKGNIESIGPKSLSLNFNYFSVILSFFHSGIIYYYLFIMISFLIFMFFSSFLFIFYIPFFIKFMYFFSLTIFAYIYIFSD